MVPLMTLDVVSLPVPSQPAAQRPWELLARAANSPLGSTLPAPPVPRIKSNFFFLLLVQNALGHTCFYIIFGGFAQVPAARAEPNVGLNSKGWQQWL